ncbi:hypothetical protein U2P60_01125 [Brucella sp. H1_1004]|uniref:hypothetical protein n=1 Tax=Brucella sp. H1_1004 TaxID=3110109 RepID=UPI0039B4EB9D
MAKTINYDWDLPSPGGLQLGEIAKIATTFTAIDVKIKSFETALSTHKHAFADLTNKPTTLGGFGITDGMTADEVAQAIKSAVDNLVNGSGEALDTLKELADALGNDPNFATSVGTALGVRVRVDAATNFSLAQRVQGRANIDALGTVDKGAAGGVASLDSGGKVPAAQLPALTTTATVGAAIAGSNGKVTPADGDFFTGVEAGSSTMFKTTWANIKAALQAFFDGRYLRLIGGTLTGPLALLYPRSNAAVGDRNYTPAYIGRIGSANLEVTFFGEERVGTDVRAVISAKSGSVINYFAFTHTGDLEVTKTVHCSDVRASGWVYSGTATFRTDGNIFGSKWNDRFGNWDAGEGIFNRIEQRAREYADDRKNGCLTDTRVAGWVEWDNAAAGRNVWNHAPSGYFVTSTKQDTSSTVQARYFAARQPQIYIPAVGWRALGGW